jgi:hypothetical protein
MLSEQNKQKTPFILFQISLISFNVNILLDSVDEKNPPKQWLQYTFVIFPIFTRNPFIDITQEFFYSYDLWINNNKISSISIDGIKNN